MDVLIAGLPTLDAQDVYFEELMKLTGIIGGRDPVAKLSQYEWDCLANDQKQSLTNGKKRILCHVGDWSDWFEAVITPMDKQ